ncbi:VQ motif-containing protein 4-like [Curcuma longa]|uniref:VQ motif-containing protein 4-like n=1 Tax=Curcuma longa TaxID=136217 RepID=UPI003D9E3583
MESSGHAFPRSAGSSSCVSVSSGGVRPKFMDAGGCPTTFVQADADSFKRVVQKLTGHGIAAAAGNKAPPGPKKQPFKLYERRDSLKSLKAIRPPAPAKPATLSPSVLDFPSLALVSPITPLVPDPFRRGAAAAAVGEEERAIAEKGFYLHPPPRSAVEPPRLLSLFPVTSPTMQPASSSS